MRHRRVRLALASAALSAAVLAAAGGPAAAVSAPKVATLYVAPPVGRSRLSPVCQKASYSDINDALSEAIAGDEIVVCPGTYSGSVSITTNSTTQPVITTGVEVNKSVDLVGLRGATIDAVGLDNGVTFYDARSAKLRGFTIVGALGEGVYAVVSTKISIADNVVRDNDAGTAFSGYAECKTSAGLQGSCGYGIHLLSVTDSTVLDNTVQLNSGGILLTDEWGPTHANTVRGNVVKDNKTYSGIELAGNSSAALGSLGVPTPKLGGVYGNTISHNIVISNGTGGQGGGILLTASVNDGAAYSNLIFGNEIDSNGLGGITIHKHFALSNLDGNTIADNFIGSNNVAGEAADSSTTGIFVGRDFASFPPVAVTIYDNTISFDHYGIFDNAGGSRLTRFGNHFVHVAVDIRA